MAATEITLADAVVAELNDPTRSWQTPTVQFTAARNWAKIYQAPDLSTLQVNCVALEIENEEKLSRLPVEGMTYNVAIDFQQMIQVTDPSTTNRAAIDAIANIVEAVHDFFRDGHRLNTYNAAKVMQALRPTLFDEELLYNHDTFETTIFLHCLIFR